MPDCAEAGRDGLLLTGGADLPQDSSSPDQQFPDLDSAQARLHFQPDFPQLISERLPPAMQCPQHGGAAGTKLQAVMETLQRQQAARLALEEKITLTHTDVHSFVESHLNRSVRAFHRYQSAMQDVLRAEVTSSLSGVPLSHLKIRRAHGKVEARRAPSPTAARDGEDVEEAAEPMKDEEDADVNRGHRRQPSVVGVCAPPHGSPAAVTCASPARCAESPSARANPQHGWTYEEQFKQVRVAWEELSSRLGKCGRVQQKRTITVMEERV